MRALNAKLLLVGIVIAFAMLGLTVQPHSILYAQSSERLISNVPFTAAQASLGRAGYVRDCAQCHGANLDDSEFGPPVKGVAFSAKWAGKSVASLFMYISSKMPTDRPGKLDNAEYTQVLTYMLQANGAQPGSNELPSDTEALSAMTIPAYSAPSATAPRASAQATERGAEPSGQGGRGSAPAPSSELFHLFGPSPLDKITPVTDALLQNPPAEDWLMWRRTYDDQGYSPLKQINTTNVAGLRLAWTYTLATGPNEVTPIVHDGVLFAQGYGDHVYAFDAGTGDILWQYDYARSQGVAPGLERGMALYDEKLFVPTSDAHLIALNIKNGELLWNTVLGATGPMGYRVDGGPLVAKGKVMIGTVGRAPGGNFIVGLDAATGKEAWRFNTIAQPGEPGDSWNGVPAEQRNGASVWTPGSYEAALGLAYFGPGQTYDTAPVLHHVPGKSNDGLYTDTTLALDPETGKLVWHYQHLRNDQWDMDWAFERQVVTVPFNGVNRKVVVTMGKQVILDALDAATGKYVFSYDSGLQNIIQSIDPETGEKHIDPKFMPNGGTIRDICPHAAGAKTWLPGAYDPSTKIQFQAITETCMDLVAVGAGERGSLSTGLRWVMKPRADSDGNFGRLQAINLETRKVAWINRQSAPKTTGVLATAGGLLFSGALDRRFTASDSATGKVLWETRLNDTSISSPITYSVNGKQYVAITTGTGGLSEGYFRQLWPDGNGPRERASMVWVFELGTPSTP